MTEKTLLHQITLKLSKQIHNIAKFAIIYELHLS